MNEQNQTPSTTPSNPPAASGSWREQRRAERMERLETRMERHAGRRYGWTGGAFIILLGIILLLQNMGIPYLTNWWALFILIPAFWTFVGGMEILQDNGRLTRRAAGSFTTGILLTALALILLSNVTFGLYWPVLLIAAGLAILATGFVPE